MLKFAVLCAVISCAYAGYASSASSSGAGLYNNQNTGSYSKYPYSNQYSGYQNNFVGAGASAGTGFPFYAPFAPLPQIPTPYDFNNAFQQYYGSLNNNFANLYNQQLQHQNQLFNNIRNQAYAGAGAGAGSYSGGYAGTTGGNSYAPNYASAGGSVGNHGVYQHASVYPSNPYKPNIDTRFGDSQGAYVSQAAPGTHGVSSFASSSSSDINGHRSGHREAITSVNNNGKVTTYHVRS